MMLNRAVNRKQGFITVELFAQQAYFTRTFALVLHQTNIR